MPKSAFRIAILPSFAVILGTNPARAEAAPSEAQPAALERAQVERIISSYREKVPDLMAEIDLPGLAVALVDRTGPLWVEGFGYLDGQREAAVDEHTIFSMQSSSKAVTAAPVAVRDGLVDLDTPITEYIPEFSVNSRFESHPEARMTLRHLLGHRAGFTHEAPVGNNYDLGGTFDAHIQSIRETWLRYPVGEHHAYANLGVDLAGFILGVVSGKGFPAYVQEAVLDPLAMGR